MTIYGRLFGLVTLLMLGACGSATDVEPAYTETTIALEGGELIWPGDAERYDYTGTSLALEIASTGDSWLTLSAGDEERPIELQSGTHIYPIVSSDTVETLDIRLQKRSSVFSGSARVMSAVLSGELKRVPAPTRTTLVIGDSISAGFGVDGAEAGCAVSDETTNFSHSYAALAADALNADVKSVSISGRGLVRNYGDGTTTTIAQLYEGQPLSTGVLWPEMSSDPEIIVIHLGTTDFYQFDASEAFQPAYEKLMSGLRAQYPSAYIYAAFGPMLGPEDTVKAEAAINNAIDARVAAGDEKVGFVRLDTPTDAEQVWACAWNPSAASHAHMAEQLVSRIEKDIR